MEIQNLASTNSIHTINKEARNSSQNKCQMAGLRRLATFSSLKANDSVMLSKGVLARAGLYYTGTANQIKCDGCDFEYVLYSSDINPIEQHARQNPTCQFVLNNDDQILKECMFFLFSHFSFF